MYHWSEFFATYFVGITIGVILGWNIESICDKLEKKKEVKK